MPHGCLRRLAAANYRGTAAVHWSMTIDGRRTGWLDAADHAAVRELLLHTLARYLIPLGPWSEGEGNFSAKTFHASSKPCCRRMSE